jgi:polysaccharide deacetylase family protein (PEP-CTERM system associated)
MKNAFTIDVEDYFQVSAFSSYINRKNWGSMECRVEKNIDVILKMLSDHNVKATFFTLGWIAERYPNLVNSIVKNGHELASHGYSHERASDQSEKEFRNDISLAKKILEDLSGLSVVGYRAPSFSINDSNLWAFDVLKDVGYRYSSSVYPIKHDHYGMPNSPRFCYQVKEGLIEIPVTTVRFFNKNLPSAGGGYFRLLPYQASKWMLRKVNNTDAQPAIFYFHPWEIDVHQPRIKGVDAKSQFRHYVNINKMENKLRLLLTDFQWGRMDEIFLENLE